MTHRQLECFLKTAETLNMTKAAKELYISQPSLSEQIRKLEEELGVQLFIRKDRRLRLTIAGKTLIGECYEFFAKEKELIDAVRTADMISARRLTICYIAGLYLNRMTDLTQRFHRKHPDIMLALKEVNWNDMNDLLEDGDYDVGFYLRLGDYEVPGSGHFDLASTPTEIWMADTHPLASYRELTVEDIRDETFCLDIMNRKSKLNYFSLYELFRQHHVPTPNVMPAKNLENILVNVRSGIAITILSTGFFGDIGPGIVTIPIPEMGDAVFSLYWNARNDNPAISLFADFVTENF